MLQTFTALAEPNRLAIVELLRGGPQPVGTIGDRLQMYQPQVSKHLRVLRDAGLVEVEPRAQQRVYALRQQPLRELELWLDRFRALWDARLENLERYLIAMEAEESNGAAAGASDAPTKARSARTRTARSSRPSSTRRPTD